MTPELQDKHGRLMKATQNIGSVRGLMHYLRVNGRDGESAVINACSSGTLTEEHIDEINAALLVGGFRISD